VDSQKETWSITVSLRLVLGLVSALASFYFIDIQRFERISSYINRIAESSNIGLLFSANDSDKFTPVIMVVLTLALAILFNRNYKKNSSQLQFNDRVFWLTNILLFYFLLLPIYEPLLMARFISYLTLPLLFIVAYTLQNGTERVLWKRVIVALVVFCTVIISIGDITSLFRHNKNKEQCYNDLLIMKEKMVSQKEI